MCLSSVLFPGGASERDSHGARGGQEGGAQAVHGEHGGRGGGAPGLASDPPLPPQLSDDLTFGNLL